MMGLLHRAKPKGVMRTFSVRAMTVHVGAGETVITNSQTCAISNGTDGLEAVVTSHGAIDPTVILAPAQFRLGELLAVLQKDVLRLTHEDGVSVVLQVP